ncbi:TlpA disulfide reductase family protein [Methyloversatilis thermotolerans]|uniref:TlpA disulfide reductase family protein n=1 Tax=Methyloversatilis thermotolerans TaxID=1346290 RepID=UPI00036D09BB|nr:TlpA disulfide reductase family protein [Methyloversatilis thermotolerans]
MKPWTGRLLAAAVIVAAGVAGLWFGQRPEPDAAPTVDGRARLEQMKLADARGQPMPFSDWRGKLLVVNFWATWCAPCREEMPLFSRMAGKYAAQGVQFVGISIDNADNVRAFQQQTPVDYPLLIGGADAIQLSADLGNAQQAMPFTVIVGRDGRILERKLGTYKEAELAALLARHAG